MGPSTDTILFYARSPAAQLTVNAAKTATSAANLSARYTSSDEIGPWADGPIMRSGSMGPRPKLVYEYDGFTPGPAGWRMKLAELKKLDEAGDLYWTSEGRPRRKLRPRLDELDPLSSCWTDYTSDQLPGTREAWLPDTEAACFARAHHQRVIQAERRCTRSFLRLRNRCLRCPEAR